VNPQLTLLEQDRTLTAEEAGLRSHIPDGPAKLLAQLVKRGLEDEHLEDMARLLLTWDALAPVDPDFHRICSCGCLRSLKDRRANTKYFDGACRAKARRASKAPTLPQPSPRGSVTGARLPVASDGLPYVSEAA
jgi:hypothetical protein